MTREQKQRFMRAQARWYVEDKHRRQVGGVYSRKQQVRAPSVIGEFVTVVLMVLSITLLLYL